MGVGVRLRRGIWEARVKGLAPCVEQSSAPRGAGLFESGLPRVPMSLRDISTRGEHPRPFGPGCERRSGVALPLVQQCGFGGWRGQRYCASIDAINTIVVLVRFWFLRVMHSRPVGPRVMATGGVCRRQTEPVEESPQMESRPEGAEESFQRTSRIKLHSVRAEQSRKFGSEVFLCVMLALRPDVVPHSRLLRDADCECGVALLPGELFQVRPCLMNPQR